MVKHIHEHAPCKPFACKVCGKIFKAKSKMKKHVLRISNSW